MYFFKKTNKIKDGHWEKKYCCICIDGLVWIMTKNQMSIVMVLGIRQVLISHHYNAYYKLASGKTHSLLGFLEAYILNEGKTEAFRVSYKYYLWNYWLVMTAEVFMSRDHRHMICKHLFLDISKKKQTHRHAQITSSLRHSLSLYTAVSISIVSVEHRRDPSPDLPLTTFIHTFTVLRKTTWKIGSERTAKDRSRKTMRPLTEQVS